MHDTLGMINRIFDRTTRLHVQVLGRSLHAFQFWAVVGLFSAITAALTLGVHRDLSMIILGMIALSGVLTVLLLALTVKIITGEEVLVCYHSMIAVFAVISGLLFLMKQPLWIYLDITAVGLGIFLSFGRIGCFMVGCCHGRPAKKWGVCYGQAHVVAGFNSRFKGQRLIPVQLLESMWLFLMTSIAAMIVLSDSRPGSAFFWYVVAYGTGRFWIEFFRGDAHRPVWSGYSEAQWISVVTALGCLALALTNFHILWYNYVAALSVIGGFLSTVMKRFVINQGRTKERRSDV